MGLKTKWRRFVGLRLKIDRRMKTVRGHVSTSYGFLRREGSHARVSQFGLKTGGGAVADRAADHARGTIVELPSRRRKRDGRFDGVGCGAAEVGTIYPLYTVVFS